MYKRQVKTKGPVATFLAFGTLLSLLIPAFAAPQKLGPAASIASVNIARGLLDKFNARDYPLAVVELDRAIKLDPQNSAAYAWRAIAYCRMQQYDRAFPDYDMALKIDPRNGFALSRRGFCYYMSGNQQQAFADLNDAIAIDSKFWLSYVNRGKIHFDRNDFIKALADFDIAKRLNPADSSAYVYEGDTYLKMKLFDKAVAAYSRAIQLDPKYPGRFYGRGVAYDALDVKDRALADYSESIRISPNVAEVFVRRGRIYLGRSDPKNAIKDATEALRIDPKSISALVLRSRAYEAIGDLDSATTDLMAILSVEPAHSVALAGRVRIEQTRSASFDNNLEPAKNAGRVALVIGNSSYRTIDRLANPTRDANLVAESFKNSGFQTVQVLLDGTRAATESALKEFAALASKANWAIIYYAGHGIEYDGNNFLVPVDAQYINDSDIPLESIALDEILNAVNAANQLRLVILDACRENPFEAQIKGGILAASGRGLARIEPKSGTLVAFATKHGHVASDGSGANSPFTTAFANRVNTPGLEVNQLFRLVHDDVYRSTDGGQEPFTYGQLSAQEHYFRLPP